MGFRLSGDQIGPGFGFLTHCRTFNKLYHIFGAAYCTLLTWTLFIYGGRNLPDWNVHKSFAGAIVVVAIGGFLYEIWQGIKNARIEAKLRAAIADLPVDVTTITELAAVENRIARLDGFSVRDIMANTVGQFSVFCLYYVLFRMSVG